MNEPVSETAALTELEYRKLLGSNIIRARAARKVTQEVLAQHAGISRMAVGLIERGEVSCRAYVLYRVADYLATELKDIEPSINQIHRTKQMRKHRQKDLTQHG